MAAATPVFVNELHYDNAGTGTASSWRSPRQRAPISPVGRSGLENLWDAVLADAPPSAYSYVFEGQAQTLDALFVIDALADELRQARFAHINADWPAEFAGDGARGVSDHDPMVARFRAVGGSEDLRVRLTEFTDSGAVDGTRADRLLRRIDQIERFLAGGRTEAACGQLTSLAAQSEVLYCG